MIMPFIKIFLSTTQQKAVVKISSLSALNFGAVISGNFLKAEKLDLNATDLV